LDVVVFAGAVVVAPDGAVVVDCEPLAGAVVDVAAAPASCAPRAARLAAVGGLGMLVVPFGTKAIV